MRIGYLGPEGTFSQEALLASMAATGAGEGFEAVGLPTIYDTVMAVHDGRVQRAIVPMENSLEGSVDVTLDALAGDASDAMIVGEAILPVSHCLIAAGPLEPEDIATLISHPQVIGQCARFVRSLPDARVLSASSTADAVRQVVDPKRRGWAALGNRLAAQRYDAQILREGVEDHPDNQTRFVWLAHAREAGACAGAAEVGARLATATGAEGSRKTSLVFSGPGAQAPGWLVRCLSEFASREVNLSRIESRPRRQGLGSYMFFVDVEGDRGEVSVAGALEGLELHCDRVRVLGSYRAA